MSILTAGLFLINQRASRAAWQVTFALLVPAVSASIIAAMVYDDAFSGPHPYRSVGWAMLLVSVGYVPIGIARHYAHIRKVRQRRRALALTSGDPGAVMLADAEAVETTETADILQLICCVFFVLGGAYAMFG